jgi:hypothetical protein
MTIHRLATRTTLAFALGLSFCGYAAAQTAAQPAAKPAAKAVKAKGKTAKAPAAPAIEAATPEQVDAAGRVYYGAYECELDQKLDIATSTKYPSYVELKHGKTDYLMKPVLSSTGAIRLEDVRGEALMVQIAAKSMLLNVKTGHRIVDACVSAKQRDLMAAAKADAPAK